MREINITIEAEDHPARKIRVNVPDDEDMPNLIEDINVGICEGAKGLWIDTPDTSIRAWTEDGRYMSWYADDPRVTDSLSAAVCLFWEASSDTGERITVKRLGEEEELFEVLDEEENPPVKKIERNKTK